MTYDDLMNKILQILPDAIVEEDVSGEVIVATGLKVDDNDNLVKI